MPNLEQPQVYEAKTVAVVDRIKNDPRLAKLYEEPGDERVLHGRFAGHPIIGKDMSVLDGVYLGAGEREAIVVKADDQALNEVFQRLVDEFRNVYNSQGPNAAKAQLLDTTFRLVQETLRYDKDGVDQVVREAQAEKDKLISLGEFIRKGVGVCRHQALLTTYLLQRLQKEGIINAQSKISIDRNSVQGLGGHAWTRYTSRTGEVMIIDPAQNFIGKLEQIPNDKWLYKRKEDMKSAETTYEEFFAALRQAVELSEEPYATLESFVRNRIAMVPQKIISMAKERSGLQAPVDAMIEMLKRRLRADGVLPPAEAAPVAEEDAEQIFTQMAEQIAKDIRAGTPAETAITRMVDHYLKTHSAESLLGQGSLLTVLPGASYNDDPRSQLIEKFHRSEQVLDATNEVVYGYRKNQPKQKDEDLLAVDFSNMPDQRQPERQLSDAELASAKQRFKAAVLQVQNAMFEQSLTSGYGSPNIPMREMAAHLVKDNAVVEYVSRKKRLPKPPSTRREQEEMIAQYICDIDNGSELGRDPELAYEHAKSAIIESIRSGGDRDQIIEFVIRDFLKKYGNGVFGTAHFSQSIEGLGEAMPTTEQLLHKRFLDDRDILNAQPATRPAVKEPTPKPVPPPPAQKQGVFARLRKLIG